MAELIFEELTERQREFYLEGIRIFKEYGFNIEGVPADDLGDYTPDPNQTIMVRLVDEE